MIRSGAAPFDLNAYLKVERGRFETTLVAVVTNLLEDAPSVLAAPIQYALAAGGKRLRPILCVSAFRAAGGDAAAPGIYEVAAGLELVHGYSLVHDDLPCMDDDDLRRGRPSTHRRFGEEAATLAGAAMIPLACLAVERGGRRLGRTPPERAVLVEDLCRGAGAGGMVGGQLLDLAAEGRDCTLEELEAIHERKTGALLAASARLGALAAGATSGRAAALDEYGRHVGLAFQIADDVLDVTAESAILGKAAGSDRKLEKATFASVIGVEGAVARARAEADAAIASLRAVGIADEPLEGLARFAVERDR